MKVNKFVGSELHVRGDLIMDVRYGWEPNRTLGTDSERGFTCRAGNKIHKLLCFFSYTVYTTYIEGVWRLVDGSYIVFIIQPKYYFMAFIDCTYR